MHYEESDLYDRAVDFAVVVGLELVGTQYRAERVLGILQATDPQKYVEAVRAESNERSARLAQACLEQAEDAEQAAKSREFAETVRARSADGMLDGLSEMEHDNLYRWLCLSVLRSSEAKRFCERWREMVSG